MLEILNSTCNPFTLKELYLDGCDGVTDECLDILQLAKEETDQDTDYDSTRTNIEKLKDASGKVRFDRLELLFPESHLEESKVAAQ